MTEPANVSNCSDEITDYPDTTIESEIIYLRSQGLPLNYFNKPPIDTKTGRKLYEDHYGKCLQFTVLYILNKK
jgi:hypothetical protein